MIKYIEIQRYYKYIFYFLHAFEVNSLTKLAIEYLNIQYKLLSNYFCYIAVGTSKNILLVLKLSFYIIMQNDIKKIFILMYFKQFIDI